VAWSGQFVFDVVIFVLTLWRSYYLRTPGRATIANVFLRDGVSSFAFVVAAITYARRFNVFRVCTYDLLWIVLGALS